MAENSKIEWTDATWNPIRARRRDHGAGPVTHVGWHCEKVSAGCDNCYAEGINLRLGTKLPFKPGHLIHTARGGDPRGEVEVFLDERMLTAPLRWKKPRLIFVNSMTDSFGRFVTDEMLDRMFAVMALAPQHTFQVLTKRAARMREYVSPTPTATGPCVQDRLWRLYHASGSKHVPAWPLPNVWLGVSAEDQQRADERIPDLLATPAAVRFGSFEPLLGQLDVAWALGHPFGIAAGFLQRGHFSPGAEKLRGLDWIIVGGESGRHARPMHPDWARSLRDQAQAAGVPFLFKQHGEFARADNLLPRQPGDVTYWPDGSIGTGNANDNGGPGWSLRRIGKKAAGRLLDGVEHNGMPRWPMADRPMRYGAPAERRPC